MKITDELLSKIASLSKLSFSEEEKEVYKQDFQKMLDFVDKLQEVDTEGVEPLIHMTKEVNRLRKDVPSGGLKTSQALSNSPKRDARFFRVPKVLKK